MTIRKLNHVMVTIPKGAEAQARAFYCGVLGLTEIPKPESLGGRGGFWLQLDTLQIHIGTEDGIDRLASKAHFAYEVDDLEHWRAAIERAGLTILDSIPLPGYVRFECRDPFGNRIEFIQSVE